MGNHLESLGLRLTTLSYNQPSAVIWAASGLLGGTLSRLVWTSPLDNLCAAGTTQMNVIVQDASFAKK